MTTAWTWDKAQIKTLLQYLATDTSENASRSFRYRHIVFRMLQSMNARQTDSEQETESTDVQNGEGFNGNDAGFLTNVAKSSIPFDNLTAKQSRAVAKRLVKYAGQLEDIAANKLPVAA